MLPWLLSAIAFQRGGEKWTVVEPLALLALVMVVLHWSRLGSRAWTRVESKGARVVGSASGRTVRVPEWRGC